MAVFAGDLTDFALPAVLRVLADNAKTGLLEIVTDDRPGGIELVDGRLRTASADRRRAGFAHRLLGTAGMDASTLRSVLATEGPSAGDHHLAEQLVRGAHLDAAEVAALLREHTIDAVLQMVRSGQGSFHFRPRREAEGESAAVVLRLPAAEVVEEVTRRQRVIETLTSADVPLSAVLTIDTPPSEEPVHLSAGAWRLLAMLDGRRSLGELLEIAGTGVQDTYRQLAELLDAGVVTADPAAPTRASLEEHRRLSELERRWASELDGDGAGAPGSPDGPVEPGAAAAAPAAVGHERTATITSLSSRERQRHADTAHGIDERTLRRLIAGVEALP